MAEMGAVSRDDLLDLAARQLAAAGEPAPRREAGRLWRDLVSESVLGPPEVGADAATDYLAGVARRAAGEPLAHVTGWTGFRHLRLRTDARALIPRPETEGLVELALQQVRVGVAADIGTGTGAIALALAMEGAFDEVIGIDRSADALALARENGAETGYTVTWLAGDLVAPLQGRAVDLVVSNPPYLTTDEVAHLDPSVAAWEPHEALDGGPDGLDPYRRLFADVPGVLREGGWLALELDARRARETAALAEAAGWQDVTLHDDLFGRARYLLARREMGR